MRVFKLYILLILFGNELFSQLGPGYLGRRVQIGYGINFGPAIFGSNAQNESLLGDDGSAETGTAAFNLIQEGFLEFAFSNRWSVGFSGRYYKTTYDNATPFGFNYYNPSYDFVDEKPAGYYNITGLTYTFYFKRFGRRYLAPWGRYFVFGPAINISKTQYDPYVMYARANKTNTSYNYESVIIRDFGPTEQSFTGFNLMFGLGRTRIVANRITLDYGFNTHVLSVLSVLTDYANIGLTYQSYNISNNDYIENTFGKRVRGVNRFNLFLKVGILLF